MTPSEPLPPSVRAAARSSASRRTAVGGSRRAYPPASEDDDVAAMAVQLAATRALVLAQTAQEVVDVVRTLVHDLGGGVMPARLDPLDLALPLDISFGLGEPLLPYAEPVSVAAMRLRVVLPPFLEDARVVLAHLQARERDAAPDREERT